MTSTAGQGGARLRRAAMSLGGVLLVAALLAYSLRPALVSVEVAPIVRQPLVVTVNEQGRTRAREPYLITAPVSGQLRRTSLKEGDRVDAGQALVELAVSPEDARTLAVLEAARDAASARVAAAQASLTEASALRLQAEQEARRRDALFAQGQLAPEVREQFARALTVAESREQAALASVQAAQAEEVSARARLLGFSPGSGANTLVLRAPVQGTVQQVFEKNERVVPAGTPLFQLSDGDSLELMVDLLTQDAVRVSPGDTLQVSGWGGAEILQGRVLYVEPQAFTKISALGVEEQRVYAIGELTEPNPGLGAQYRIEAAIVVDSFPDALTVPTSALFRRDERWQVFVVTQGQARLRAVEIGARGQDDAQVLDGLSEGEQVVIFPSDLVVDGVPVLVLE